MRSQAAEAKREVAEGTLRVGPTLPLLAVLRTLGADPAALLAEAGIDPGVFDDADQQMTFASRGRLANHCAARKGCRHLGLLVGQRSGLHSLGVLRKLLKYSPDVVTALRCLVRYCRVHVRGTAMTLELDGHHAALGFESYEPRALANEQVVDGALAVMLNVMRGLCGANWTPVEIQFAHGPPEDVGPYRRLLRAPLRFDAEQNALLFAADCLDRALPAADPEVWQLLKKEIDALDAQCGDDFTDQVRNALRSALVHGQGNLEQVAALFSMRGRTLDRRLNALGTGFRQLANEIRFETARQLLGDSDMSILRIGSQLGYADQSAFTRAFRRWSGTTPAHWRATPYHAARGPGSNG